MATAKDLGKAVMATGQRGSGGAMRKLLDMAIEGTAGLKGARQSAASHLDKHREHEEAIDAIVTQHVSLAGAQGFATNIGGVLAAAISIPANMVGVTVIQCRMVASIAHLRGYDLDDPRVRSAILICLLGEGQARHLVESRVIPSTPLVVATAPVHDPAMDAGIADAVLSQLAATVGGKKLPLLLGKKIPVIGGGVGAVTDGYQTFQIAVFARREFADRRRH